MTDREALLQILELMRQRAARTLSDRDTIDYTATVMQDVFGDDWQTPDKRPRTEFYTRAPEAYDGFGTFTVINVPGRDWRRVSIVDEHREWQSQRYSSGMYGMVTDPDFAMMIVRGQVKFTISDGVRE